MFFNVMLIGICVSQLAGAPSSFEIDALVDSQEQIELFEIQPTFFEETREVSEPFNQNDEGYPTDGLESSGQFEQNLEQNNDQYLLEEEILDLPAPGMTRLYFLEEGRGRRYIQGVPYSVSIAALNLSCSAPCILDVPVGRHEIAFTSAEGTRTRPFKFHQREVSLLLERGGSDTGVLTGTILLVGGAITELAGIIVLAKGYWYKSTTCGGFIPNICSYDSNPGLMWAGGGIMIAGIVLLTIGPIVRSLNSGTFHKYKGNQMNYQMMSLEETIQDSFQFGIVPTKEGFSAGAGFNF